MKDRSKYVALFLIVCLSLIVIKPWGGGKNDIPPVSQGQSSVFIADISHRYNILEIDATPDLIYFAYANIAVVSAYDWNGDYQFSIALYNDTNGQIKIRCEENLLYIRDLNDNIFIYDKKNLINQFYALESEKFIIPWFNQSNDLIHINGSEIIDYAGNVIMVVPGVSDSEKVVNLASKAFLILFIGVVIVIKIWREHNLSHKRDTGRGDVSLS